VLSVEELALRHRRRRAALGVLAFGGLTFLLLLVGAFSVSRHAHAPLGSLLSAMNIACLFVSPLALGIGASGMPASAPVGLRIALGLLTGLVGLAALVVLGYWAWTAGGGRIHL
jgi:hypothetical protein